MIICCLGYQNERPNQKCSANLTTWSAHTGLLSVDDALLGLKNVTENAYRALFAIAVICYCNLIIYVQKTPVTEILCAQTLYLTF